MAPNCRPSPPKCLASSNAKLLAETKPPPRGRTRQLWALPLRRLQAFPRFFLVSERAIGKPHGGICLGSQPGAGRAGENDVRARDRLLRIVMLLRVNGEVQVAERVERLNLRGHAEMLHSFLELSGVQQRSAQVILSDVVGRGDLDDVRPQDDIVRSEEHTSELQSLRHLVC